MYRPATVKGTKHGAKSGSAGARLIAAGVAALLCGPVFARQDAQGEAAGAQGTAPPPVVEAPAPIESPFDGREVMTIRFEGLVRTTESLIRNQLRTREGQPYSEEVARDDVRRLYRLGEFRSVEALVEESGAGVVVVYRVREAPIIQDVQAVGNRRISDQDLGRIANDARLIAGTPVDEYQLGRAVRAIEEEYRNRGYLNVEVTIDEAELDESGIVLFRIREGERIKVTDIRFEGNTSIEGKLLRQELNTKVAGLFEKGPVDEETLVRDVSAVVRLYRTRGFLDVRADYQVIPSPNGKEAIVTFIIDEGPLYRLRHVLVQSGARASGEPLLGPSQVIGLMKVKPGDVYGVEIDRGVESVRQAYWKMGFTDVEVRRDDLRDPASGEAVVDMLLTVGEGRRYRTGEIVVVGNDLTKDKIIRRELQDADVRPDRPLDRGAVNDAQTRLVNTRLFEFGSVKATIQPESPQNPGYRDVVVEVEETDTGSLAFGAAVGSDSGVVGLVSLEQRNFDLLDSPASFGEFLRGQAFRGAGQTFSLAAQPGTEVQTYSATLSEPRLFDSDYALGGTFYYRDREYDRYDEERLGGRMRLGRRFGERWVAGMGLRVERVNITDIDYYAPVDVFAVEGPNLVTGVGVDLTRTTVPTNERFRPTRGTRLELGVEQVGALGGDFTFTKLSAEHQVFLAVWEDYLGRKGVVSFKTMVGWIPQENESPVYERFYLGGRTFRGFEFRTISPKGIRADNGQVGKDPVGGDWMFFFGAEYEHPVFRDFISAVAFVDTGTVTDDPGFDDYRVAVGLGLRIYLPQLSQAPLAFDFGVPLLEEDGDVEQVFSFSIDLPF